MFESPVLVDPFAEVVTLLQPSAPHAKVASGAGAWQVRGDAADYPFSGKPFYAVVMEGACRLTTGEGETIDLGAGDFVLIPATRGFVMSSPESLPDGVLSTITFRDGETRHGDPDAPADVRLLVGHFVFGSPDATLLVSLLPDLVLVRGQHRLATLVQLVTDEARSQRPAREVILARLLEVLLIEALRSTPGTTAQPGLLRGLHDPRLAEAIRRMHERPTHGWTIAQLAQAASLSRSAFFERFFRAVGMAPMEYLLSWRMALAKNLLQRSAGTVAEVAESVGYGSASAFSVAFTRFVGVPPTQYARAAS